MYTRANRTISRFLFSEQLDFSQYQGSHTAMAVVAGVPGKEMQFFVIQRSDKIHFDVFYEKL